MGCSLSSGQLPSAQGSSVSRSSRQSRTLKSGFRIPDVPALQWSREVPLTDYIFTCSTAEYQPSGEVKISRSDGLKKIAIAEDWLEGEKMSKDKNHSSYKTGFIGCGFTKRGVYVSPLQISWIQLNSSKDITTRSMLLLNLSTTICPFYQSKKY